MCHGGWTSLEQTFDPDTSSRQVKTHREAIVDSVREKAHVVDARHDIARGEIAGEEAEIGPRRRLLHVHLHIHCETIASHEDVPRDGQGDDDVDLTSEVAHNSKPILVS